MAVTSPFHFHVRTRGPQGVQPVLLLHGFLGTACDWDETVGFLSMELKCIAVDLPGHGATRVDPPGENLRMERVAGGLNSLLTARGLDPCHLVGYSMGGRLALYMAVHHPERCARVVIESASPGLRTEPERLERRLADAVVAARLGAIPYGRFLDEWYSQPLFETLREDRERFDRLLERRLGADPERLAAVLRRMGAGMQPPLWEHLSAVKAPVLLITGEKDAKFRQIADEMASLLRNAFHVVVAGAGHNVHWEKPEEYARLVRDFLRGGAEWEPPAA